MVRIALRSYFFTEAAGSSGIGHGACRHFAAKGFVTLSFEYRLSRNEDGSYPHPEITPVDCVKDARSAMRWVRREASTLRIDANRISAWGWSAGGQLVWSTVLCDGIDEESDDRTVSPVPNALLTFSACYNTVQPWCERMLGEQRARIWDISPYHRLKKGHPPAIGFHGLKDTTEPVLIAYWFRDKTIALGNPFELVTLADQGHDLAGGAEPPGELLNKSILERVDAFLRETGMMPGSDF
jgi:acetyl esterase/lipase